MEPELKRPRKHRMSTLQNPACIREHLLKFCFPPFVAIYQVANMPTREQFRNNHLSNQELKWRQYETSFKYHWTLRA